MVPGVNTEGCRMSKGRRPQATSLRRYRKLVILQEGGAVTSLQAVFAARYCARGVVRLVLHYSTLLPLLSW